ncbi:MAG: transcriptional regulator [Bacteroidetes bacterium]|nr:MAG: transcriptional regulator [Bacteroidota bacterium]
MFYVMNEIKLNKEKVFQMLIDLESEQIERTISITDTNKFAQAVCAFSNDISNTGRNGYLFIGAYNNGALSGMKTSDKLLQTFGGLRSDGNILPQPIMSVQSFSFDEGDIIVIEVQPSPFPPVRYRGKTWIRVGPRKAVANEMEERILIERRSANVSMFDIRPCLEAGIIEVEKGLFINTYLPHAIDVELLKSDKRDLKGKLAALRFYTSHYDCLTNVGVLLLGKRPEYFIPGGYIQFVRFKGKGLGGDILNEKKFSGNLMSLLPRIEAFIDDAIIVERPVPISTLQEKTIKNFPNWAIRELMMNAIMHRDYESNAPIKFYQFDDRIEISNAGGLFGKARPENFPNENDYRNPVIAEAMKVLGYVNRYNRGISRVEMELKENGNPDAVFNYKRIGAFGVTVFDALYEIIGREYTSKETGIGTSKETGIETKDTGIETKDTGIETKDTGIETKDTGIETKDTGIETKDTGIEIIESTSKENMATTIETEDLGIIELIIGYIQEDNTITTPLLAAKIGMTKNGLWYHLDKLKKAGRIKHIGSTKGGKWVVLKE